jgi:hypothetical protein
MLRYDQQRTNDRRGQYRPQPLMLAASSRISSLRNAQIRDQGPQAFELRSQLRQDARLPVTADDRTDLSSQLRYLEKNALHFIAEFVNVRTVLRMLLIQLLAQLIDRRTSIAVMRLFAHLPRNLINI